MLAALLATRIPPAPPPPVFFYGNQFVAATTTFTCIFLTRRAAMISTNPVFSAPLLSSMTGSESILSQLDRYYSRIVNSLSSDADMINSAPYQVVNSSDLYLSDQISGVVAAAFNLNAIIQGLSVAPVDIPTLIDLQRRMTIALKLLQSLAIPITLNYS
jgi:hypothetical protein